MSCVRRQSCRSLVSFLFICAFFFYSAAAFACPSDKDTQVTEGFATRDANAALNDYALLFQDTIDANVACQQVAHDRFLQKLQNIFNIYDPSLLNSQPILKHQDILLRTVLPFQGWLEGADAAMAFILAYRLNALGLLSPDIAQYLDKVAELLVATGTPTGVHLPAPFEMPAQKLIELSSLESDPQTGTIICGLNETQGWADECMDDYSVASAGFAWAAAYQKLRGINPQAAIDRANLLISETFSGRASVCLVFKDTINPAKNPPSIPQYGGANQRGPCQATPADVKLGTALVFAQNHGHENPAYGIGLMTSTSTALLGLSLAGASHGFSDYEQSVAKGLLDEEQRTTSGSQFSSSGCYGFSTSDNVTFTYDSTLSCILPEDPPYFPDMFPVHKFYESFIGLDSTAPFPLGFNDNRFPKDDFNQVNGRFGAGRELYYGSYGWDNRMALLPLLLPSSTPPPFPQLQGMHATSSCDRIDGFAEDMTQTNNPVDVSIYRYVFSRHTRSFIYELIATLSANVGADLVPATSGRGYHGFLEYLPNLLKDGTITPIRVQFTSNNQLLSNTDQSLDTSACAVNPPPGPYEGWFDFANCDQTGGWVWDPNFPTTPVDIEVLVDGVRMAVLSANLFGSDLLQAGKGDGKHRFTWYIPAALKGNGSHTISFRTFGANSLVLPIVSPSTTSGTISCAAPPPPPPAPLSVSLNTPAGSYVTVSAPTTFGQTPYADVTFDSVLSPGNTTFTPMEPSSAGVMPAGYRWPTAPIQPVMMQISTSAVFSGNVTVRVHATAEQDSTEFDQLRIMHLENSQYVDLTTLTPALGAPDFPSRVFQAPVAAFSPFNPFMIVRELVPVTLTGTPQVASITYGQSVGITAQLASSISTPAPTGTLTLMDGGAAVQTAAVQGGGSYSFTAAGLSAGLHTFTIAYSGDAEFLQGSSAAFNISVSPAPLSISVQNASRFYGDANPVFTGTITGLLNGDNITASYQSSATVASPVGTYAITVALSDPGGRLGNYSLTQGSGTLTVQAAPLQATANTKTKMYGDPLPVLDGTITGIRNADNIMAQYSTTATAQSLLGTYPITVTLSDPNNKLGNYAATLTNSTLTVTRSNIALAAPSFNPSGGTYPPGTSIAITEPTSSSAAIHYTTNGTTPTASSPLYTGPIAVSATSFTQIQAMATQPEYLDSAVGSASYSGVLSVSATPASQTLVNCASVNYSVSIFPPSVAVGTLTFSVSGLPAGATASFSPATVNNSGSSTLTVTTSTATPPGTYTLTVSAGNAAISGSKSVTLVVQDFNFSLAPSSQAVTAGGGANYTVSGTIMNGFAGTVGLSLSGLPAGASGTFSPASYTGAGASTLSVSTATATPVGSFSLTVTGTYACRVHTFPITLVVNAPPPTGPSINSLSVNAGPVGTAVTISGVNFGAIQGSSTVTFNGTVASPTSWSSTSITVATPAGAKTGNVVVSAGGQVSNGVAFTVQDDAVHIFGTNCATCGWQTTDFTIQTSSAYGYTIRSGDILYFYQWQNASSVAGIEVCFPGGENVFCADGTTIDQDAKPVYADTITAATHFRRVDLSASAGQTLNQISFHSHGSTKAGRWDVYFSNVQIVSADGSVRSIFVTGSTPGFFVSTSFGVTGVGWAIEHNHVW